MQDIITAKQTNKYGCRPSQDVCLEHDSPLVTFGMCVDSPELKELKHQLLQALIEETKKLPRYDYTISADMVEIVEESNFVNIEDVLNNLKTLQDSLK